MVFVDEATENDENNDDFHANKSRINYIGY